MRNGKRPVAVVASLLAAASLSGCQTITLGAPRFPPCYLDSDKRAVEADAVQRYHPETYEWVREMDALCVAWSSP